jgi:hypothetical protein
VGLFDRLKSFAAPVPDADAAMPRWARITHIDRADGPLATVEMEIHYGNTPPFTYTDLMKVPVGISWVGAGRGGPAAQTRTAFKRRVRRCL